MYATSLRQEASARYMHLAYKPRQKHFRDGRQSEVHTLRITIPSVCENNKDAIEAGQERKW